MSTAKEVAKRIRRDLRIAFPTVKFRVVTDRGVYVDSVSIHYTMDPKSPLPQSAVYEVIGKYSHSSFNGLTDSWEKTNVRSEIPQCQAVSVHRHHTE